jgi:alpha-N-arabinofuranosidase
MRAMTEAALNPDHPDGEGEIVVANTQTAEGGSNQFRTALSEAAFLTGVERNSDIVIQTSYAPLYNLTECDQWSHNLIDFNPKTLAYTANYYVQKMFSNYLGTEYVPFGGELPEHVFASVTEDADAYYVKLVNTSDLKDDAVITFPQPVAKAEGEELHSDDLTVRNALGFFGETDYRIVPAAVRIPAEGSRLCVPVKPHAVLALKVCK